MRRALIHACLCTAFVLGHPSANARNTIQANFDDTLATELNGYTYVPSIWEGSGSNDLWYTLANWEDGSRPSSSTNIDLVFAGTQRVVNTNDIADPFEANSIQFAADAGPFVLEGGRIRLYGGVTNLSTGVVTVATGIDLVGDQTWNTQTGTVVLGRGRLTNEASAWTLDGSGDYDLQGVWMGNGDWTKTGDGTMTMNASNWISGSFTVDGGRAGIVSQLAFVSTTNITVQNGATLEFLDNTGFYSSFYGWGSDNTRFTVTGAGSVVTGGQFQANTIGAEMVVEDGGHIYGGWQTLGSTAGRDGNRLTVTDPGSLFDAGAISVGMGGLSNHLTAVNGADVRAGNLFIGFDAGAEANRVRVSDTGTTLRASGLYVGYGGGDCGFSISNGASLIASDTIALGNSDSSRGNDFRHHRDCAVTASNTLRIGHGTYTMYGGTLDVGAFHIVSTDAVFRCDSGLVHIHRSSSVTNGQPLVMGDGVQSTRLTLDVAYGKEHVFRDGLVIQTNASLFGSGVITEGLCSLRSGTLVSAGSLAQQGTMGFDQLSISVGTTVRVERTTADLDLLDCSGAATLPAGGTVVVDIVDLEATGAGGAILRASSITGTPTWQLMRGATPETELFIVQSATTVSLVAPQDILSPMIGPASGGNTMVISNIIVGTGADVTSVTVGGVAATITGQGTDWVEVTVPTGPQVGGIADVVIESTSEGTIILEDLYTYNPAGWIGATTQDWSAWEEVSGLPTGMAYNGAAVMDESIYAMGGYGFLTNTFRFDEGAWSEEASMPLGISQFNAATFSNRIYTLGGYTGGTPITNVYAFDGTNWSSVPSFGAAADNAAVTWSGTLYSIGGYDGAFQIVSNTYAYDGASWTPAAGPPEGRRIFACAAVSNRIYMAGGEDASSTPTTNCFFYDGSDWTEVAGLPNPTIEAAGAGLDGSFYVIGGWRSGEGTLNEVHRFDGASWTSAPPLPATSERLRAVTLDGNIYAIGGLRDGSTLLTNVYRYPSVSYTSGVQPSSGSTVGGYPVVISGLDLGDGTDITNVTLAGTAVTSIDSQNSTQVVVTAGNGVPGLGDVRVFSTSYGETVTSNAFTYIGQVGMIVLGTNGSALASGAGPTPESGNTYDHTRIGDSIEHVFSITNNGSVTLNISGWSTTAVHGAMAFDGVGIPPTVAPGGVETFSITFAPPAAGGYEGLLSITNNSPTSPYEVTLTGNGFDLDVDQGPYVGGNLITITNGNLGNGSDITNVLVGGSAATIMGQGADWVSISPPGASAPGAASIHILSASQGNTLLPDAYFYNPAGRIGEGDYVWTEETSMPRATSYHISGVRGDQLIVAGGDDAVGHFSNECTAFDGTNWSASVALPAAYTNIGYYAGAVFEGNVLLIGGFDIQGFSPSTNTLAFDGTSWTHVASMSNVPIVAGTAVAGGELLVVGGVDTSTFSPTASVGIFDGAVWSNGIPLPEAMDSPRVTTLNGQVHVLGGGSQNVGDSYLGVYRLDSGAWANPGDTPALVADGAVASWAGGAFLIGGSIGTATAVTNVYRFDGTNWTMIAGLPEARTELRANLWRDSIYVTGGQDSGEALSPSVFRLQRVAETGVSPVSGAWTGGYPVVIRGSNLGNGTDVTNVTLAGISVVSIDSQSATQIVVTAAAGTPGLGDVVVYSTTHGVTTKTDGFTYLDLYTLAIESLHGAASPAAGIHTNLVGSMIANHVVTPDTQGSTQYVCTGWSMNGHEPTTGTATQFVMTVTNDAVLTWLWDTNYWLNTEAAANGAVNVGDGWHATGSTTAITATAVAYHHFTNWSGDVSGGDMYDNPLNLFIAGPKAITAHFQENVTMHGTPEWWLVQYGFTNDFENAALGDQDGDGSLTWEERIAGTIPTNIDSVLVVQSMERLHGSNYVEYVFTDPPPTYTQRVYEVIGNIISWPSVSGRLYQISYSTNLEAGNFMLLDGATNIPATPDLNIYTNEADLRTVEFFRIDVELDE